MFLMVYCLRSFMNWHNQCQPFIDKLSVVLSQQILFYINFLSVWRKIKGHYLFFKSIVRSVQHLGERGVQLKQPLINFLTFYHNVDQLTEVCLPRIDYHHIQWLMRPPAQAWLLCFCPALLAWNMVVLFYTGCGPRVDFLRGTISSL